MKETKENTFSTNKKKRRNDIIFISSLLTIAALAAIVMFAFRSAGDTVTVTVDGKPWGEFSLNDDRTVEIRNGEGYNLLVIENGKAYVKEASCPDGICSAHRPIKNSGESIICLPNKVVIEVHTNKNEDADIIM